MVLSNFVSITKICIKTATLLPFSNLVGETKHMFKQIYQQNETVYTSSIALVKYDNNCSQIKKKE